MIAFKLGRKARAYRPHVPHLSALLAGRKLAAPPASVDYTSALPANLGMFLNDSLGDCTCAAVYHALQVWSANANPPIDTEPDSNVQALYEQACGYKPSDPSTDQGGVEQDVLTYLLNTGAPIGANGSQRQKIAAFVEVDPRNTDDVKTAINDCGLVYIGFNVPTYLMSSGPPTVWDVNPSGDQTIEGGHAVVLAGYDATGLKVISWGQVYTMTWAFFAAFVDEVYALVDEMWVQKKNGVTVLGMTLAQLSQQAGVLKGYPAEGLQAPAPFDDVAAALRAEVEQLREIIASVVQLGKEPERLLGGHLGEIVRRAQMLKAAA
jgi:hypothetical protein